MKLSLCELLESLNDGLPTKPYSFDDDLISVASFDSDDDQFCDSEEDFKTTQLYIARSMHWTGKIYETLMFETIDELADKYAIEKNEVRSYCEAMGCTLEQFFPFANDPIDEKEKMCYYDPEEEKRCDFSESKEITNNVLLAMETLGLVEPGTTSMIINDYDKLKDKDLSDYGIRSAPSTSPPLSTPVTSEPPQDQDDNEESLKRFLKYADSFKKQDFTISEVVFHCNISLVNQSKVFNRLLTYNDQFMSIPERYLKQFYIVYVPSGGGKTTLFRNNLKTQFETVKGRKLEFYDVDDFIKDHYLSFREAHAICQHLGNMNFMQRWFKYTIYSNVKKFKNKILLFNHPNQFPNCFRQQFNEMILIPRQMNWNVRFFNENVFTLISVLDKHKVFCHYDDYLSEISKYFKFKVIKFDSEAKSLLSPVELFDDSD